jgi:hypothetical protein
MAIPKQNTATSTAAKHLFPFFITIPSILTLKLSLRRSRQKVKEQF